MSTGRIVALCTSPQGGVPKYPQGSVVVTEFGFDGDYHCRPIRKDFKRPGEMKPNIDRHITIVAEEALVEVNDRLDICLHEGSLAENILTRGLGNLSDILPGSLVKLGDERQIVLRVMEQNRPCKNLLAYHSHLPKAILGKRGLLCAVLHGIGLTLRQGEDITIEPPH